VEFRQSETHQAALIEGLRDASLDVALTYDLSLPADLEFVALATLPPFAMLAANHPLAQAKSVSVADLADLPFVLLDLPLSGDYFLSFFDKAALRPRIVERSRDMAVVQSLVANDFGYSIINFRPLTNLAPDGKKLAFVPLTGHVQPMRMGLLCAPGSRASLTIRAFIDHAETALQSLLPDLILR
jgi:DNA-binding transcriptional LysR family regulator